MVTYPCCSRMLQHNPSSKLSPLCDCVTTQEHPPPLIDKGGIENMVGEGELPEMKIHREVMRLRICLRWELMPSGLSWWMRTTLATEHNSAVIEAIKEDLLKIYGIMSVCVCIREGRRPRVGVGWESRARVQPSAHLADLLESIRGMSGRQQCVQLPRNTWPHLRLHTQAEFCGLPGTRRIDKCSCSA